MAKCCIKIPLETLGGIYGPNLFYLTGVSLVRQFSFLTFSFLFSFLFFPSFPFPLSLFSSLCFLLSFLSHFLSLSPPFPPLPFLFLPVLNLAIECLGVVLTTRKTNIIRFLSVFALLYCLPHQAALRGKVIYPFPRLTFSSSWGFIPSMNVYLSRHHCDEEQGG